jgi:hypothetical protein
MKAGAHHVISNVAALHERRRFQERRTGNHASDACRRPPLKIGDHRPSFQKGTMTRLRPQKRHEP